MRNIKHTGEVYYIPDLDKLFIAYPHFDNDPDLIVIEERWRGCLEYDKAVLEDDAVIKIGDL